MTKPKEGQFGEPFKAGRTVMRGEYITDRYDRPLGVESLMRAAECANFCNGYNLEQSVIVSKAEMEALRECALLAKRAIATCSPHTAGCIAAALAKLDAAKKGGE